MNNPIEKIKRSVRYYYYKQKNHWVFPKNIAHLTGGKMAMGTYETQIKQIIEENLKRGNVFLDVGANVGYFSRLASEIVTKSGKVYSFEAEPFNYHALCRNTNHQKNVIPFHLAVSNEQKLITFFESSHSSSHSIYKSSRNLNGSQFLVPSMTLDYFWHTYLDQAAIHLIKLDVEGAELLVVEGMKKILSENKVEAIIVEFHPKIIKNAGDDPQTLFSVLSNYFSIFYIREKVESRVNIKNVTEFNRFIDQISESDKTEERNMTLFCKKIEL